MRGCTLAVPGSAEAEGAVVPLPVPCQEPLVPPAFPGTATPGCVSALFHLLPFPPFFFFFLHSATAGKRLFIPFLFAWPSTMRGMAA